MAYTGQNINSNINDWEKESIRLLEESNVDYWLRHAGDVILSTYGDTISVKDKSKDLLKFGRTEECQTSKTTVMASSFEPKLGANPPSSPTFVDIPFDLSTAFR